MRTTLRQFKPISTPLTSFGLPTDSPCPIRQSFKKVAADGSAIFSPSDPNPDRDQETVGEAEASLDVEWSHVLAPKANILLVEANSSDGLKT